jgi:GntR family transcriptional regulator
MAFELDISPGSASPIFKQIVDQVRLAAATGRLAAGEQLPSVRALAERLLVNPNTIAKAYGELARQGIVDGQAGRGFFIAPPRQIYTRTERLRRLGPCIDALVNEGISLGFDGEELLDAVRQKLAKLQIISAAQRKNP